MKKKLSKRYKNLVEMSKDKKMETLEEAIKKIKRNCWICKVTNKRRSG